jgi:hypothetical protein
VRRPWVLSSHLPPNAQWRGEYQLWGIWRPTTGSTRDGLGPDLRAALMYRLVDQHFNNRAANASALIAPVDEKPDEVEAPLALILEREGQD